MRRKVAVTDLRVGMYVAELDRPWRETPFLFQGFEIRTDDELTQLRSLCQHVYIDAAPAPGTPNAPRRPMLVTTPTTLSAEANAPAYTVLKRFYDEPHRTPRYRDQVPLEVELAQARELEIQTKTLIYDIMDDARLGRMVDTERAKHVVAGLVQSVMRNPDALVSLNQLKNKDEYTALHSLRVCVLSLAFARHLELSDDQLHIVGLGALLHDIGKMKVPNEVLNKPGRLTAEEFEIMKTHVPHGVKIAEAGRAVPPAAIELIATHHERVDGSGYTSGLKGEGISLFGQIAAIADCYDAITSDRVYHNGVSAHEALGKLYSWRNINFHEQLVEQFIQCMGIYPIGSIVELNTGSIGVVIATNRMRRLKPRVALVLNADKTPFGTRKIIDLHQEAEGNGSALEIRKVLPHGAFGINPTDHLPVHI